MTSPAWRWPPPSRPSQAALSLAALLAALATIRGARDALRAADSTVRLTILERLNLVERILAAMGKEQAASGEIDAPGWYDKLRQALIALGAVDLPWSWGIVEYLYGADYALDVPLDKAIEYARAEAREAAYVQQAALDPPRRYLWRWNDLRLAMAGETP
ncbi:MAG TPA: hypothetical protein VHK00_06665, partial [Miltoncostaeaceae bacterium]|nr:hypothetical protein [Miltoncostaeaceae bacterium]